MADALDPTVFAVRTRLGFNVRVTERQWTRIVTTKHPVIAGREDDIRLLLLDPDEIRDSLTDPMVHLFYRRELPGRWLCAVVKRLDNTDGFLITAYPTDAIKEGKRQWARSRSFTTPKDIP
jgi:hypothetical protein